MSKLPYVSLNIYDGPRPGGVPNPFGPRVHPYPTRYHGPIYTRPMFRFPWHQRPQNAGMITRGTTSSSLTGYFSVSGLAGMGGGGALGQDTPMYGWSSEIKALQEAINPRLDRMGRVRIKADGTLRPATCGGAALVGLPMPSACSGVTPEEPASQRWHAWESLETQKALHSAILARGGHGISKDGQLGAETCGALRWFSIAEPKGGWAVPPTCQSFQEPKGLPPPMAPIDVTTPDDRVKKFQSVANANLAKLGYQPVRSDGILDAQTCTAIAAFARRVKEGKAVDSAVKTQLRKNGRVFLEGCQSHPAPWPSLTPVPQPPPEPTVTPIDPKKPDARVSKFQALANPQLDKLKIKSIRTDGVLDAKTCGAFAFFAKRLQEGKTVGSELASHMKKHQDVLYNACRTYPTPWPPPEKQPWPPGCRFKCGGSYGSRMRDIKRRMNTVLKREGYKPISTTSGVYGKYPQGVSWWLMTQVPQPKRDKLAKEIFLPALVTDCRTQFRPTWCKGRVPPQKVRSEEAAPPPSKEMQQQKPQKRERAPSPGDWPALCFFECGKNYGARLKTVQRRMNDLLESRGKKTIRVSGIWDQETGDAYLRLLWLIAGDAPSIGKIGDPSKIASVKNQLFGGLARGSCHPIEVSESNCRPIFRLKCGADYGGVVKGIQRRTNGWLERYGMQSIPVTGKIDRRTSGALKWLFTEHWQKTDEIKADIFRPFQTPVGFKVGKKKYRSLLIKHCAKPIPPKRKEQQRKPASEEDEAPEQLRAGLGTGAWLGIGLVVAGVTYYATRS